VAEAGDREAAVRERSRLLDRAAADCFVFADDGSAERAEAPDLPPTLTDPVFLCGVEADRLDPTGGAAARTVSDKPARRLPVPPPDDAAGTRLLPPLVAYVAALDAAAGAEDIAALEAAGRQVARSFGDLAGKAGPFGVVAGPAVTAVGNAATTLTGITLREKRFELVRTTVREANPHVTDVAAVACHGTVAASFPPIRQAYDRLRDAVVDYNVARTDTRGVPDTELAAQIEVVGARIAALRAAGRGDVVTPVRGIAEAHDALHRDLERGDRDFDRTVEVLRPLAEDLQKAGSAIGELSGI
jgi:hypothetical protein